MAKYLFAGKVCQISQVGTSLKIDIIPNTEYVASRKKDVGGGRIETVTIAVFQPVDEKDQGMAFCYANHVTLSIQMPKTSSSWVCGLSFLACGKSVRLELETGRKTSTGICTCQINCPKAKKFDIVRVSQ